MLAIRDRYGGSARIAVFAVYFLGTYLGPANCLYAESRTWTDKTGKYKIEAEFVELTEGNVRLKKSNGKIISLPLGKLSKEDQQFLRQQAKERREGQRYPTNTQPRSAEDDLRDRFRQGDSFEFRGERTSDDGRSRQSFSMRVNRGRGSRNSEGSSSRPGSARQGGFWTDITGKHKIEASFVSLENDMVRLRRSDGKVIKLALDRLSEPDQERARILARNSSTFAASDSPFGDSALDESQNAVNISRAPGEFYRGDIVEVLDFHGRDSDRGVVVSCEDDRLTVLLDGEDDTDTIHLRHRLDRVRLLKANPDGANYSEAGIRIDKVNRETFRTVTVQSDPTGAFQPDSQVLASEKTFRSVPLSSGSTDFFAKFSGLSLLTEAEKLFVAIGSDHPGLDADQQTTRVVFFDLTTGKVQQNYHIEMGTSLAAVSPSGNRFATLEEGDSSDAKTLHVWSADSAQLVRLLSWNPLSKEFFKKVQAIHWVSEDLLITAGFNDLLIWDVNSKSLLLKVGDCGSKGSFALSPNRRQIAVGGPKGIVIIDLESREVVQKVEPPETRHFGRLAFCPSGQLLAASHSHGKKIDLINLESAEIFDTLNLDARGDQKAGFFWPDDQHILIGGTELVHVASKTGVWRYQHNASHVFSAAGYIWYALKGNTAGEGYMVPVKVPHPQVAKVDDSQLALKPGDAVSLEVRTGFNMGGRHGSILEESRKKLTEDLEEAGFYVSDDAPNKLVATTEDGETKKINYRRFGDHFNQNGEVVQVTPRIYQLKLFCNEEVVWQRKQVQSPSFHLSLQEGESINDAIQRVMQPSAGMFGIGIPSRILKPDQASSRQSTVTAGGLK